MNKFLIGFLYTSMAGLFISTQSVFNTKLNERIGLWETTAIVHLVGLVFGVIMVKLFGNGDFTSIVGVNKLYLSGGILGVMIVYGVMQGVLSMGASVAIGSLVVSQLVFATIIDSLGLFGMPKIPFTINKLIGGAIMLLGLLIFQKKW